MRRFSNHELKIMKLVLGVAINTKRSLSDDVLIQLKDICTELGYYKLEQIKAISNDEEDIIGMCELCGEIILLSNKYKTDDDGNKICDICYPS